jgi:CRISPR/Cas system CSM-associated protein Csm3 (group 7 of RAMP superfamily)
MSDNLLCSFLVENQTPLIVKHGLSKGNFYSSLPYIPASTLFGAIESYILETSDEKNIKNALNEIWQNKNINEQPWFSNAYITELDSSHNVFSPLNPPDMQSFFVRWTPAGVEYVDCAFNLAKDVENKDMKKGSPDAWFIYNGKIKPITVRWLQTTHVSIDPYTRTSVFRDVEGERKGELYNVRALLPNHRFHFKVVTTEDNFEIIKRALQDGVQVGGLRSKGYGVIKSVSSFGPIRIEEYVEKRIEELQGNDIFITFITDCHENLITTLKERFGVSSDKNWQKNSELIYYDYLSNSFIKIKNCIKKGSFIYIDQINDLDGIMRGLLHLEVSAPEVPEYRRAGMGWLYVNHPVHFLEGSKL